MRRRLARVHALAVDVEQVRAAPLEHGAAVAGVDLLEDHVAPVLGRDHARGLWSSFADNGIRKGNVATQWQNICHELFPSELRREIAKWVKDTGKDIKNASKHFKSEIAGIPEESRRAIEERAYREVREMLVHFRAPGTGTRVIERLAEGA